VIPVHVIEAKQHLRVYNFHIAQTLKHLLNALKSLSVSYGGPASVELIADLLKGLDVVLHDQTGAKLCTILILQVGEAG